ncbi:MAG: hypothetical protein OMM_07466 [Candidatus Magnetoglobus multicellularis str. Araruama]|uniref:Fe-S oxidoreductase n=1 Tax=Candidatus Magnetoglobus multicellularis str. Araruama TaxID=890399 RepID=A0A1V1PCA6_9BACT|nr:MAG: hypothetical protein OMM_07466 [Candidatus Magnetoglobus multicellularis str. Araruama]
MGLSDNGLVTRQGFNYVFDPKTCEYCPGFCCCGESGFVWINQNDIHRISSFLSIPVIDCIQHYLRRINNRYSAQEYYTPSGLACIFFDSVVKHCQIYTVRPAQCRSYPFWDCFKNNLELCVDECPGVRSLCPDSI